MPAPSPQPSAGPPEGWSRLRPRDVVALCGIGCGAAMALVSLLGRGDFIGTEIISHELARNGPAFLVERLTHDCEGPGTARFHGGLLYHVLLWVWLRLGHGEGIMRAFSVVCGLVSLAVLGKLARPLGRSSALALVALCATSPMLLNWFTSARAYGLFFLLAVAASGCLLALVHAERPARAIRWAGLYLLSVVALLYTHHFAIHLLAAHAAFALVVVVIDRQRIWRTPLAWAAVGLGAAAAAPLWPILQLHRLSRDLVARPGAPREFLGTWFHHGAEFFTRIFRQFDHFNLVGHSGVEAVYIAAILALTGLGAIATWRRSRVLFAFFAVVLVVPIAAQAAVVAFTGHTVRGLRYYIYLVPVLHLPWVLLVQRLSGARTPRWRAALPTAVLAFALALNLVSCGYAWNTLTWSRNHGVTADRDVIPDLQPWRMQTDWPGLARYVREQQQGPSILLTETIKETIYLDHYLPGEPRLVNLGKGSRRPAEALDGAPGASRVPVACTGLHVWQISMGPPREVSLAGLHRAEQSAFGILHLVHWEPRGRPAVCSSGPNVTMLDAHVGDRETFTVRTPTPGIVTLTILARLANEPPFAAGVRVAVDGRPPLYYPVGASAALVHLVEFELPSGTHRIVAEIVPAQEADPGACWSTQR